jgi:hypothetical protein
VGDAAGGLAKHTPALFEFGAGHRPEIVDRLEAVAEAGGSDVFFGAKTGDARAPAA